MFELHLNLTWNYFNLLFPPRVSAVPVYGSECELQRSGGTALYPSSLRCRLQQSVRGGVSPAPWGGCARQGQRVRHLCWGVTLV